MNVYKAKYDGDDRIIVASDTDAIVVGLTVAGQTVVTAEGELERLRTNSNLILVDGLLYTDLEELT